MHDRQSDRQAIELLNQEFCHQLDRGSADGFVDLFAEDALYTSGSRIFRGRQQIREFYLGRTQHGPRTSRHFLSFLRVEFLDTTHARGLSAGFTFAADGCPPFESTIPAMVADFEDLYVAHGSCWRFVERRIIPLFRAILPR
jgi:uncharacterized protein (TIGR02246 family)